MPLLIKIVRHRHLWFTYYWAAGLCVTILLTGGLLWFGSYGLQQDLQGTKAAMTWVGGVWASYFALLYFVQKQKLEEDRLVRELFKDFNDRYDALRADLERIMSHGLDTSNSNSPNIVERYMNLCAEEYFFYSTGRIPDRIWESWRLGMCAVLRHPAIRGYVDRVLDADFYYGFDLTAIGCEP